MSSVGGHRSSEWDNISLNLLAIIIITIINALTKTTPSGRCIFELEFLTIEIEIDCGKPLALKLKASQSAISNKIGHL